MKKIKLVIVLSLLCAFASQAQEILDSKTAYEDSVIQIETHADKYRVETNYFKNNWFIGLGIGTQAFIGDHTIQMKTKDAFSMAYDVYLGKWFTPGIGVRLGVNGYQLHGVSGWSMHHKGQAEGVLNYEGFIVSPRWNDKYHYIAGEPYAYEEGGGYPIWKTNIKYIHGHADVMFNLSQMIGGYKSDRFYELVPYIGLGWMHSFNQPVEHKNGQITKGRRSNELAGTAGIYNSFRINPRLFLVLDLRGTYVNDRFDAQIGGRWGEGLATATVGLTYRFGGDIWYPRVDSKIHYNAHELEQLRQRLNDLANANRDLQAQLQEQGYPKRETQDVILAGPLLVTFKIDTWDLSNEARVNLGFLAQRIKETKDAVFVIQGYADAGTGSTERNQLLAKKRSEVVYNCLVNEFKVPKERLRTEDFGGVENMFYDDPRCSRSVITKVTTH